MNRQTKTLLKENNQLEKQLSKETDDILTDIVVYIRSANITEYNQELVRRDITNMLIEGQERGQSAAEVIGEDYKAFCDAVIAEMPQMTKKERALDVIKILCYSLAMLTVIWFAFSKMTSDISRVELTVGDLVSVAVIIAIAFGTYFAVTRFVFDAKGIANWKLWLICCAALFMCIIPSLIFKSVVAYVPTIAVVIVVMVLLAVYKILDR